MDKIFKGLIRCGNCNKRFTPIKENNSIKYICSTYHHAKDKCIRNVWSEWDITEVVSEHCFKNGIPIICSSGHMKEIIKVITIYDKERYRIEFNNGKICGWISDNTIAL